MHVIAADVIVADIATEFDLTYMQASQFVNDVLEDDDWNDNDEELQSGERDE